MILLKIFQQLIMTCVNRNPLVVICGATGTGKSKLAIEIAKHYGGEVINADALQIYAGMDIATNKVTIEECEGIKHHMLGTLDVKVLDYCVHDFQREALDVINKIRSKNKLPILVGGTNYYIESVLWERLINVSTFNADLDTENELGECQSMENDKLHAYLKTLDRHSADLLHPNNRRKVWRALEIALKSKKTQTDFLQLQNTNRRFHLNEAVLFWMKADKDQLNPRLDKRVGEMLSKGLLDELSEMQRLFNELGNNKCYTKGVFQAIGFKEFHDYLNLLDRTIHPKAEKILLECVEKLKIATKRYVNIQNKWIRNRFLKWKSDKENVPVFKLDATDLTNWQVNVFDRAVKIIDQINEMNCCSDSYEEFVGKLSIKPETLRTEDVSTPCYRVCEICDNKVFTTEQQWLNHNRGRRHQKNRKRHTSQKNEENLTKDGKDMKKIKIYS